jgi:xanthine dehydrogenase accessory factor
MSRNKSLILLRGGGDLASGVALRLHRAGFPIVITELAQPLAVRRSVSFAEAVFEGQHTVEGVTARLVKQNQIEAVLEAGEIPVLIDPNADILLSSFPFLIVVDGRLTKHPPSPLPRLVPLHIGLGPGFHAGRDCDAVIETRRSHTLGRVYWQGTTQADSGQPEGEARRVLRAPGTGIFIGRKKIGEHCESGEVIAMVQTNIIPSKGYRVGAGENLLHASRDSSPTAQSDIQIVSEISGVLRGILRDGLHVTRGLKVGDIDPRDDAGACYLVSDKALAIGGGVLEAILSREEIRAKVMG